MQYPACYDLCFSGHPIPLVCWWFTSWVSPCSSPGIPILCCAISFQFLSTKTCTQKSCWPTYETSVSESSRFLNYIFDHVPALSYLAPGNDGQFFDTTFPGQTKYFSLILFYEIEKKSGKEKTAFRVIFLRTEDLIQSNVAQKVLILLNRDH